jgi:hypothetical protein
MVSGWFGMYIVAPITVAVGAVACLILIALGLPFALAVPLAIALALLLFALPYRNQLHELGLVLALAGGGWLGLMALWNQWAADAVVVGVLALVVGLLLFIAALRIARYESSPTQ